MILASGWVGLELDHGRYRLLRKLGEGGMGVVYAARDNHVDADVVIKAPRESAMQGAGCAARFSREIRSLVRLSHPFIVRVLDAGEHAGIPFVVLQYLPGGDLYDRAAAAAGSGGPMSAESLGGWLPNIAGALDFIHAQHFVHRDVKPANILFDGHGNAYLSDFGLAKGLAAIGAEEASSPLTATGLFIGTPAYMAPELFMGQGRDGRVDQYALSMTVYEMLAGRHPLAGKGAVALLAANGSVRFTPLQDLRPSLPRNLTLAVEKGLAWHAEDRFHSCAELAQAILTSVAIETPVSLLCPDCHGLFKASSQHRGQSSQCGGCGAVVEVAADLRDLKVLQRSLQPGRGSKSFPLPAPPERVHVPATQSDEISAPPLPQALVETPSPVAGLTTPPSPWAHPAPPRRRSWSAAIVLAWGALLVFGSWSIWHVVRGQGTGETGSRPSITEESAVSGFMNMDFRSRRPPSTEDAESTPPEDIFEFKLYVRGSEEERVRYAGDIRRTSAATLAATSESHPGLALDVRMHLEPLPTGPGASHVCLPPTGRISGFIPCDDHGRHHLLPLRSYQVLDGFSPFGGELETRPGPARETAEAAPFERAGSQHAVRLPQPSAIVFRDLTMPADSTLGVPEARINGSLTYYPDADVYLTHDLRFDYGESVDRVQGAIYWEQDAGGRYLYDKKLGESVENARSQHIFTLVFNPPPGLEVSAAELHAKPSWTAGELSKLTGAIRYEDDGLVAERDGELYVLPQRSRAAYEWHAHRLSNRQLHTFLKLWLLISGQVNEK